MALGVALMVVPSCGSDDKAKKVTDEDAGAAGMEAGGGEAPQQGGSSSQPAGGQGGAPVVIEGGAAGEAPLPEGGTGQGGAGGVVAEVGGAGGALDCPAQPGAFTYSCGEIRDLWNPRYDSAVKMFHFDTSILPFPIIAGYLDYFYYDAQSAQFCGTAAIDVEGRDAYYTIIDPAVDPTRVRITEFTFMDVCGSTHTYDPLGAPECNDLEGTGQPGTWALTCVTRFGACPDICD